MPLDEMRKELPERVAAIQAKRDGAMSGRELVLAMKAAFAQRDEVEGEHAALRDQQLAAMEMLVEGVASMLAELIEKDGDKLAGDGYLTLREVADHFGCSPATIKAWGKDHHFPAPLGGWEHDGKRWELRFRKGHLRTWRAMMHGRDPERAHKVLAKYAKQWALEDEVQSVRPVGT